MQLFISNCERDGLEVCKDVDELAKHLIGRINIRINLCFRHHFECQTNTFRAIKEVLLKEVGNRSLGLAHYLLLLLLISTWEKKNVQIKKSPFLRIHFFTYCSALGNVHINLHYFSPCCLLFVLNFAFVFVCLLKPRHCLTAFFLLLFFHSCFRPLRLSN